MIDRAGQRQLCLSTQCLQDKVLVTVSDTGSGLDPAIAKQLFLPFQTTKPERLGLGLAICRKLIEAHGGCIGMQPATGGGTAFYFELPRNTAPDPRA
jgi:signal transduction histidine kinase